MQPPLSADTSIDAETFRLDLFRRATPARRAALAISWSRTAMMLARDGLRRRSGGTEDEISILFVRVHYGDELADRLQKYLQESRL